MIELIIGIGAGMIIVLGIYAIGDTIHNRRK